MPLDRPRRWHNQVVSDAEALGWALDAAKAAAGQGAGDDLSATDRLARAGTTAIEAMQACEARATWYRPGAGAPDPQLVARHDVRAAAQAVLAQLELIGIAWPAWDASTRSEMLSELEESTRQLVDHAEGFNRIAT